MKNLGPIARAVLALTLSTAALVACSNDNGRNDNNNGYNNGSNVVAFPNSAMCGQVLPEQGFNRYRSNGFRRYHMESNAASAANSQESVASNRTDLGYGPGYGPGGAGYGPGYGPGQGGPGYGPGGQGPGYGPQGPGGLNGGYGFNNGFAGCGGGFIPACDTMNGGGGLTCVPSQGLPLGNIAGYNYGQGNFGYNGPGLNTCGYGGNCFQQIAQTCVIGMPNGCAQGACYPVGNGAGVCAIQ